MSHIPPWATQPDLELTDCALATPCRGPHFDFTSRLCHILLLTQGYACRWPVSGPQTAVLTERIESNQQHRSGRQARFQSLASEKFSTCCDLVRPDERNRGRQNGCVRSKLSTTRRGKGKKQQPSTDSVQQAIQQ